jgi:hypothetical protein
MYNKIFNSRLPFASGFQLCGCRPWSSAPGDVSAGHWTPEKLSARVPQPKLSPTKQEHWLRRYSTHKANRSHSFMKELQSKYWANAIVVHDGNTSWAISHSYIITSDMVATCPVFTDYKSYISNNLDNKSKENFLTLKLSFYLDFTVKIKSRLIRDTDQNTLLVPQKSTSIRNSPPGKVWYFLPDCKSIKCSL